MTRKDYVKLAAALKEARASAGAAGAAQMQGVVIATILIADELAADNGRFDRDRFYVAAGMTA